jgi:hypothetical protein
MKSLARKFSLLLWIPKFSELVSSDSSCYSHRYHTPSTTVIESTEELLEIIGGGYDIVHLFCDVSPDGNIVDVHGDKTAGTTLIKRCCDSNVKLLWLASENKPEGYIRGFKAPRKPLNLVLAIDRRGSRFPNFLESLLRKMSAGETMPVAWVSLAQQNSNDPRNQDAPACIFAAGRGGVRFR